MATLWRAGGAGCHADGDSVAHREQRSHLYCPDLAGVALARAALDRGGAVGTGLRLQAVCLVLRAVLRSRSRLWAGMAGGAALGRCWYGRVFTAQSTFPFRQPEGLAGEPSNPCD